MAIKCSHLIDKLTLPRTRQSLKGGQGVDDFTSNENK